MRVKLSRPLPPPPCFACMEIPASPAPTCPVAAAACARRSAGHASRPALVASEARSPDLAKAVVIAAPHSSNRDFFVGIALVFAMRLDVALHGKGGALSGTTGTADAGSGDCRSIGTGRKGSWPKPWHVRRAGEPGPRGGAGGNPEAGGPVEERILPDCPGGRRPDRRRLTSTTRAGVVGFGPPFQPTGDMTGDIAALRAFFAPIRGGIRSAEAEPLARSFPCPRHDRGRSSPFGRMMHPPSRDVQLVIAVTHPSRVRRPGSPMPGARSRGRRSRRVSLDGSMQIEHGRIREIMFREWAIGNRQ